MIQLSDTRAASVMGALLGLKPKAGGDSSAFALALGSLAADGAPDFAIAPPRQAIAAPGSDLPEGGREAGEENAPDIGLIFAVGATTPVAPPADDARIAMEPEPADDDAEPRPLAIQVDGRAPSTAAAGAESTPADPMAPVSEDAATPAAQRPGAAADRLAAPAAPETPSQPVEPRPIAAPVIGPPIARRAAPLPATVPPEHAAAPSVVDKPAASPASPGSSPTVPPVGTSTPPAIEADSPSPAAAPPVTADRPTVAARLKPAAAPTARSDAPGAKPVAEPAIAAAMPAPVARNEPAVPTPAKFVPVERAPDTAVEPAPRRIALAPVVPVATGGAAVPMTVADLIPAQHRPRTGSPLVAPVVDPASVGVTAPVDAASRIADPAPIDMHAADWMETMIEQIDVMRDARADGASATTTRIRLSPDVLGGIDIMLVGDGDAIDVRITADTAAARTLLAEAAPRLTDMAEARGLKLAQGDAGQSGQHQAQRQQQQDQPTANRRHAADPDRAAGDLHERIA